MPFFDYSVLDADPPQNPHIKIVGDINGDGLADVVAAGSNGGPLVWYAAPEWAKHTVAPAGKWSTDGKLVDMTGNGYPDILISEWYGENRLEWWENPAPNCDPASDPWRLHVIGPPKAHNIETADLDGDGRLEIVTRTQGDDGDKFVVRKRVGEEWRNRVIPCPAGEGLALGDVNGDGRPDVVVAGRWYETPADPMNGDWREHVFTEWSPDSVIQLADMNGDGRLDIILSRSEGHYRLSWFESPANPADRWAEHVIESDIDYAHSLIVADMDGDGRSDIVTAEMHQSRRKRVLVYWNKGSEWERQILAETGSHNLCVGDVDGDGRPDIIGANWSGDRQPLELWRRR